MPNANDTPAGQPPKDPAPKKRGGARPGAGRKPSVDAPALQNAKASAKANRALAHAAGVEAATQQAIARTQDTPETLTVITSIAQVEAMLAPLLPGLLPEMLELAHGAKMVRREYEAAALVLVDDYETDEKSGKSFKVKKAAFPDKKGTDMVLVKQVEQDMPPDGVVLQYLFNRIMGKPAERKEMRTKDEEGQDPLADLSRQDMLAEVGEMFFNLFLQRRAATQAASPSAAAQLPTPEPDTHAEAP